MLLSLCEQEKEVEATLPYIPVVMLVLPQLESLTSPLKGKGKSCPAHGHLVVIGVES